MSWAVLRPSICGISSESKPTRPLAKWLPCSSSTQTASPAAKSPFTSTTPAASRLAAPPRTALAAPESATSVPCGWEAKPIHSLRDEPRSLIGANAVPTGSPIIAGPAFDAHVNTAGMPDTAATRAASILVTMPPVPTFEPVPPT